MERKKERKGVYVSLTKERGTKGRKIYISKVRSNSWHSKNALAYDHKNKYKLY
jgi:hypothetical protein